MASLKKLAGQTVWYGVSNIAAKLLNQFLTPLLTYLLVMPSQMKDFGNFGSLFAGVSFLNVVYTYGMETAYFRFSSSGTDRNKLFNTTFSSLLVSTALLSGIVLLLRDTIADFFNIGDHPEYIAWCVLLMALETMFAIPFARLRQEERPRKYAFVKVSGILVYIMVTFFFVAYSPGYVKAHPTSAYSVWYQQQNNVGFLVIANLLQNLLTFLLLAAEWKDYRFKFDKHLWKKVFNYGAPMILVGLGGMVNETLDRIMLPHLYTSGIGGELENAKYVAVYKIAIFITLFITAFRMSAEPFFFGQAKEKNAPATYARVMKWFVIVLCFAFLFSSLFLDVWKYFVGPQYRKGNALGVVPILLAANVCLGIYYNLSVWYKLTDRMRMGMYVTLIGATLTIVSNFLFIPQFGMYACAWTTFAAYFTMMVISYFLGQKYFPIPYDTKKLLSYLGLMILLFGAERLVMYFTGNLVVRLAAAVVFMALFVRTVLLAEKEELKGLPVVGKFIG